MKILAVSLLILGWLTLGFSTFAGQLDSITVNTGTTGIFVEDGDDGDLDETKTCSLYGITATFRSGTGAEKVIVINRSLSPASASGWSGNA